MNSDLHHIIDSANTEELEHIFNIIQEQRIAEIVAEEYKKTGSNNLTDDNIRVILAALSDDFLFRYADDKNPNYTLVEWLEYWFGGESKNEKEEITKDVGHPLTITGVFFKEGDQFFENLNSYIERFSSSIDSATEISKARGADVQEFIKNSNEFDTNPEAKANVQKFFDKYSEQIVVDENGQIKRYTYEDPETGEKEERIMTRDPYGTGLKFLSSENKKLTEASNAATGQNLIPLFEELVDNINSRLMQLTNMIEDDYIYSSARSIQTSSLSGTGGSSKSPLPKGLKEKGDKDSDDTPGKGGETLIVGLSHLLETYKNILDLYPEFSRDNDFIPEKQQARLDTINSEIAKILQDQKKFNEEYTKSQTLLTARMPSNDGSVGESLYDKYVIAKEYLDRIGDGKAVDKYVESIQEREMMYEDILLRGEQPTEEIESQHGKDSVLLKELSILNGIVNQYENEKNKQEQITKDYSAMEIDLNSLYADKELIENYFENSNTYDYYEKAYQSSLKLYDRTIEEIEKYKAIYTRLTGRNVTDFQNDSQIKEVIKSVTETKTPEELKQIINDINPYLKERERIKTPVDVSTDRYKSTEGENAISPDSLEVYKDTFVTALQNYDDEQTTVNAIKEKVREKLISLQSSLLDKYNEVKSNIQSNMQTLKDTSTEALDYTSENKTKDFDRIKSNYTDRFNAISNLQKDLKGVEDYKAGDIYRLLEPKYRKDTDIRVFTIDIARSLAGLDRYLKAINDPKNEELKKFSEQNGITEDLIIKSMEDIKNIEYKKESEDGESLDVNTLVSNLKSINKNAYQYLISPEYGINNFKEEIITPVVSYINKSKSFNPEKLKKYSLGSSVFEEAVENQLDKEFVDVDKLQEIFNLAKKSEVLKDLFSYPPILKYSKDVTNQATLRQSKIKSEVNKGIKRQLKDLTSKANAFIKEIKNAGSELNIKLFGDDAKLLELKEKLEEMTKETPRLTSVIAELETRINSGADENEIKEQTARIEKYKAKIEENNKQVPIIQEKVKQMESAVKPPDDAAKFVDRVLFPQKAEVVKFIGDKHDPKYGEFWDSRSSLDLVSGVGQTKSKRLTPGEVHADRRNAYSLINAWKRTINECSKDISESVKSDTGFASKEDHYTPSYTSKGVLAQEMEFLSGKNDIQSQRKLKVLQDIDNKRFLDTKGMLNTALIYSSKTNNPEYKDSLPILKNIKNKIEHTKTLNVNGEQKVVQDAIPLSKEEKDLLYNLKYTPEEKKIIQEIRNKWEEKQGSLEYTTKQKYIDILSGEITTLSHEDDILKERRLPFLETDPNYKNNPKYKEILSTSREIQDKIQNLNLILFRLKYAPGSLSKNDKVDLDSVVKKIENVEKEQGRKNIRYSSVPENTYTNLANEAVGILYDIAKEDGIIPSDGTLEKINDNLTQKQNEELKTILMFIGVFSSLTADLRNKQESDDIIKEFIQNKYDNIFDDFITYLDGAEKIDSSNNSTNTLNYSDNLVNRIQKFKDTLV